jgi:hypothetical protein
MHSQRNCKNVKSVRMRFSPTTRPADTQGTSTASGIADSHWRGNSHGESASARVLRAIGNHGAVPLGEILPLLADAVRSQRTWLADFEDDAVTISTDLYEVILAYQHFRRPSA